MCLFRAQRALAQLAQQRSQSADPLVDLDGPSPGGQAPADRPRPSASSPRLLLQQQQQRAAAAAAAAARAEAAAKASVAGLLADAIAEHKSLSEQIVAKCAEKGVPWATALAFADVEDGGVGAWVRCAAADVRTDCPRTLRCLTETPASVRVAVPAALALVSLHDG